MTYGVLHAPVLDLHGPRRPRRRRRIRAARAGNADGSAGRCRSDARRRAGHRGRIRNQARRRHRTPHAHDADVARRGACRPAPTSNGRPPPAEPGGEPRRAMRPIGRGELIMAGKVSEFGQKVTIVDTLAPGTRAVSIRVDAVTSVGGFVTPGDFVDVLLTRGIGQHTHHRHHPPQDPRRRGRPERGRTAGQPRACRDRHRRGDGGREPDPGARPEGRDPEPRAPRSGLARYRAGRTAAALRPRARRPGRGRGSHARSRPAVVAAPVRKPTILVRRGTESEEEVTLRD